MNSLFFIVQYNHERNEYARYLVSAATKDEAVRLADSGDDWKTTRAIYVCKTADEVWTEV